ncbi:family 43 glycosylhydrolase [Glaciecola sp. 1036]|uniref:family 43 glycosylhydrolase n=1 Tax=Alteromonadaceae TaxID=72275 RepID=UPI003D0303A8
MLNKTRRNIFKACVAGAVLSPISFLSASPKISESNCRPDKRNLHWGKGLEGQRIADLGNGTFLNPIVSGDHPDPTILKDGDDYYMTFSSFYSYPGIVIWHSKDLVNWSPIGPALNKNIGTVWALDLCKYEDRYYIYIPAAVDGQPWSTYVIWADKIEGPWSDPIDLKIEGCIDPGHAVGEDGHRYLFVNGIRKIRLHKNGLKTAGKIEKAYEPWRYPEHWIVENFAPEGPKITRYGDYFYLVTAVGGTAGPVTGHMVIAARSKSIHGPWEDCPNNPLVRTESEDEPWWSRGHATLVEGPKGDWWMVYHGYENGLRTLGRQTLLEPIEWTDDGWFKAKGGDLSQPMPKPANLPTKTSGFPLSDDFSSNKFGIQWCFHRPADDEMDRVKYAAGNLELKASGTTPANSSPLTCIVVDPCYQVELDMVLDKGAEAGLLLFYNHKGYVGIGHDGENIKSFQYAEEQQWARMKNKSQLIRFRITNDRNVITYHYSTDKGKTWQRHPTRMEVAGINHNVFGGFSSLKVGIYCVGKGKAKLQNFSYRAI